MVKYHMEPFVRISKRGVGGKGSCTGGGLWSTGQDLQVINIDVVTNLFDKKAALFI